MIAIGEGVGNDVFAEIVGRFAVGRVATQLIAQILIGKDIDPHARKCGVGIARNCLGVRRLFREIDQAFAFIDFHDAEIAGVRLRNQVAGNREVGAAFHVGGKGLAIVHCVDMVTRKDKDMFGSVAVDNIEALENGVCRSLIPGLIVEPLLRWKDVDEFALLCVQPAPAPQKMLNERVGFVLGQDTDTPNARIQAIGECEIDNAEFPAEGNCRFRSPVSENAQPTPTATGQYESESVVCETADESSRVTLHHSIAV